MQRQMMIALAVACAATPALSATVAYYRFEEGPAGAKLVGFGGDTTPGTYTVTADSSGNGNDMRTFNSPPNPTFNFDTSPTYVTDVAHTTVPQTGEANNLAFDFVPNQDIFNASGPIVSQTLSAFTIEVSVNIDDLGRYGNIVGKDGRPTGSPIAPFQLKQRGGTENRLQAEFIDGAGNPISLVAPLNSTLADTWYDLAVTSDGTVASFYGKLSSSATYTLLDSAPVSGGLIDSAGTWTVGRGFFDGNITDWFDGQIDEVRISDTALAPSAFLGSAIPEPASLAILGLTGLMLGRRRKY